MKVTLRELAFPLCSMYKLQMDMAPSQMCLPEQMA